MFVVIFLKNRLINITQNVKNNARTVVMGKKAGELQDSFKLRICLEKQTKF